jgi:DNA primase
LTFRGFSQKYPTSNNQEKDIVSTKSIRSDVACDTLLTAAPLILFALDIDMAGAVAFRWWRKTYPTIILWPPPIDKSPGDAYRRGIDLQQWVADGIRKNMDK